MAKSITPQDMLWGYVASALNISAGLILLPVILRYFPPEDVGLWFVFITLAGFAQLLEMGFQPTIARNAAYIYAGAQSLNKTGLPADTSQNKSINLELLAQLIVASRDVYLRVSVLSAVVLLFGGCIYISTLLVATQNYSETLLAWFIFASGYIITFYFGYYNGLMQGRGDVSYVNKVIVITRSTFILLGAGGVFAGLGMIGLGAASFLASILGRWAAHNYFYKNSVKAPLNSLNSAGVGKKIRGELISILWHNASRLGVVQIGAFLIQRGNILIASSFLGITAAASYSVTVTVFMTLSALSIVICQIQIPNICALQSKADSQQIKSIYGEIIIISFSIFVFGLLIALTFGEKILSAIGSKTMLLSQLQLLGFGVIYLLELNHSIAATYLTTINRVPFLKASIISGGAITLLSVTTVSRWGVLGLILSQGIVQLAYNNWKWPIEALRHLQSDPVDVLGAGVKRIANRR